MNEHEISPVFAPSPMKGNECILMKEGLVRLPAIEPGETGRAHMDLPVNFSKEISSNWKLMTRTGTPFAIGHGP